MTPFHFVLSAPRSGSTWLAKSLNLHPEIFATEHRLFGDFCEIWPNNDGTQSPRITFDAYAKAMGMHYLYSDMGLNHNQFLRHFQKAYINFLANFAARKSGKSVVVDKVTPYAGTCQKAIQQILELMPDSKVVLLMRDGRDVLTSGAFDWLQRSPPNSDRYRFWVSQELKNPPTRFFDDLLISQWAEHWREVAHVCKKIPLVNTIYYEQLLQDHASTLQTVFDGLGVRAEIDIATRCAEATTFKQTTGRDAGDQRHDAKARKGIAGDWKNYFTRVDGQKFCELAGDELIEFGYEENHDWVEKLPTELTWNDELTR